MCQYLEDFGFSMLRSAAVICMHIILGHHVSNSNVWSWLFWCFHIMPRLELFSDDVMKPIDSVDNRFNWCYYRCVLWYHVAYPYRRWQCNEFEHNAKTIFAIIARPEHHFQVTVLLSVWGDVAISSQRVCLRCNDGRDGGFAVRSTSTATPCM